MQLAVQWLELGLGAAVSILVGATLWAVLPRGVVLTRAARTQSWNGDPVFDTWEVRNASALPIRVTAVDILGVGAWTEDEYLQEAPLPVDGQNGVTLRFDDETLEIARWDWQRPWSEVLIPPGDTLAAHVPNNSALRIRYRRDGQLGRFERREIVIHGYV